MALSQAIRLTAQGTTGHQFWISGVQLVETGGTSAVEIKLHDGTSAAGPIIAHVKAAAGGQPDAITFPHPVLLNTNNCFVEVVGTGAPEAIVWGR